MFHTDIFILLNSNRCSFRNKKHKQSICVTSTVTLASKNTSVIFKALVDVGADADRDEKKKCEMPL